MNDQHNQELSTYPFLTSTISVTFLIFLKITTQWMMNPCGPTDRVVASRSPVSAITIPETANKFVIKSNHLTLVKGNQFDGRIKTDPHKQTDPHIYEFLRICDMFKNRDTEYEVVRLMKFLLSLTGEAKTWLDKLNERTIKTWDELLTAFVSRFFLPALLLGEIRVFSQHENETLTDAWLCSSNSNTNKIIAQMDAMTMKMEAQYKELQSRSNHSNPDCNDDDIPMSCEEEAKFMQTFCRTCFYNDYRDRDSNRDNWRSSRRNDYNRDKYRSNSDDKPDLKDTKFDRFADKPSGQPSGSLPNSTQPNPKGMPNYGKFLNELVSNKHKLEQISSAFLSDESSAMIQNKVPHKLEDPGSFLIPCTFSKTFLSNALADLGASINLIPYSLYSKLSPEALKPTKMSVRLADLSFQYPIGIAENMLVEVGKFTFPMDFVVLEMEEDSKVPLILWRPFLYIVDAVIRVKQKQLNLRVGTERITFLIDSAMKHSFLNNDTCFSIDVIDEILEEDFDALLDEDSKILHSIEETILEEKLFVEFDEFIVMNIKEDT
ncbi:reverse transcriptase domain-containing protein [Tanacetum coccineum]